MTLGVTPTTAPCIGGCAVRRLSFHQDLLSPLSFFLSPLHYAAATGNTALVCYLYSEASCPSKQGKNITVASFSAGGRNGRTSWRIPVAVSPSQTASLAGHAVTAKALKQLENGVPLHWNRKVHSKFASNEFKLKARNHPPLSTPSSHEMLTESIPVQSRKLMKTLLDADWFYALPGPARVMLTDKLMTQLARDHVWGFLDKCIWEGDWHSLLGDHMMMAIEKYSTLAAEHASSQSRNRHYPPQYQFSVGQGMPSPPWSA